MINNAHPVSAEELMAHLDGELPLDRVQTLAAHLSECVACSEQAASLRGLSGKLHAWPAEPLSARVEERILSWQSQVSVPAASLSRGGRFPRWSWKRWTLMAAASGGAVLLLMAIALPSLYRPKMGAYQVSEFDRLNLYAKLKQQSGAVLPVAPPLPPPRSRGSASGDSLDLLEDRGLADAKDRFTRSDNPTPGVEPMMARSAELRVVVPKFADARAKLDGVLIRYRAYAASLQVSTAEGSPRALTASLRIPAAQLNSVMTELKALGRAEEESQSGEEVTEQHADLVARLKNSRETEQRLQDILRTRTGKVSEVLEVEQEISRVRGEIEQMEAERKGLEHRVDFATLNLTLSEEFKAQLSSPAPALSTRWHNSVVTGFRNAFDSLFALILFVSEVAPVLLLWLAILFPVAWLAWRRVRAMRAAI